MKLSVSFLMLVPMALGRSEPLSFVENETPDVANPALRGRIEEQGERKLPVTQGGFVDDIVTYVGENKLLQSQYKDVIPNIGYLFTGYNIMQGNPIDTASKLDPGFTVQIFRPNMTDYIRTMDNRWRQPNDITILQCEGCDTSSTTTIIDSTEKYVNSLKQKVSAGVSFDIAGIGGSAFRASSGYEQTRDRLTTKNEESMETEASCCVYRAEMSKYALPEYTNNFKNALQQLKTKDEALQNEGGNYTFADFDHMIEEFVEEFGTHFVKKMSMGSLYGQQSFMSKETKKELEEQGIDIALSASASFSLGDQANMSISSGYSLEKQNTIDRFFSEHVSKSSMYTRGSKPPSDGSIDSWLSASKENPSPIKVELERIDTLPTDAFLSASVKRVLKEYLDDYCEHMKRSMKYMGTCSSDPNEQEIGPFNGLVSTTNMRQQPQLSAHHYHQLAMATSWDDSGPGAEVYTSDADSVITGFGVLSYSNGWVDGLKRRWEEQCQYGLKTMTVSGVPNSLIDVEYVDSAWASRYANYEKVCPKGYAISQLASNWHKRLPGGETRTGDWAWKIGCSKYTGVEISDSAFVDQPVSSAWSAGYGEQDQGTWDFQCPPKHVLIGIKSQYYEGDVKEGLHMQREWNFRCGYVQDAATDAGTSLTSYLNNAYNDFMYVAPTNALPVGFFSEYIVASNDRRYKVVEYSMGAGQDVFAQGSVAFEGVNALEGTVNKSCGADQVLVGFSSDTLDTATRDRLYKVACSATTNIKLAGERRWSFESGLEGSFTFQCPLDAVLVGVESSYDATTKDRAWKIQCQNYEWLG